jgi:hypothetical protein
VGNSLWHIDSELKGILADIAMSGGEIRPDQEEALDSLTLRREDKLKGYLRAIRMYELEAGKVQAEVDRLMGPLNHYKRQQAKLEGLLRKSLHPDENRPPDNLRDEVSQLGVTWTRSEKLNTDKCDVRKLPEQFIRYEETYEPKKVPLKKYIEDGNEIEGVYIEEKWRMKVE